MRQAHNTSASNGLLRALIALGMLAAAQTRAVTATWTNTANGTVEYWTNNANWSASPYPGFTSGNSAYLTNTAAGAYTALLNFPLTNSVTTLVISNAAGQASLSVANAAITNATLTIGSGGRVQLAGGGSITNATLNALGTNANVRLNSGGTLFTTAIVSFGYGASNLSLLVDSSSPVGASGVWNLGAKRLYIGQSGATGNVLTINGAVVTNVGDAVMIGYAASAPNNTLVVTNGGQLWCTNNDSGIGYAAGACGEAAYVVGSNSLWNTGNKSLTVGLGNAATGNLLWVDGGTLSLGTALTVGGAAGANYNMATFTNGASLKTGASSVIGAGGTTGNTLRVVGAAGGGVSLWNTAGPILSIGAAAGSVGNALLVDSGGVVTNVQPTVGSGAGSAGNALAISAGGQVHFNGTMSIGVSGSASNQLTVSGAGALLRNMGSSQQYMGNGTAGNVFRIDNGGLATNFYNLYVGNAGGNGNSLIVSNGGVLATANASYVGYSASNNTVVLNGSNTTWQQTGNQVLYLGRNGSSGNVLRIENGALASGFAPLYLGNTITDLQNQVILRNGRLITGAGTSIVGNLGAPGNSALIDGPAALWDLVANPLTVGLNAGASGNSLTIANGGVVTNCATLKIGSQSGNGNSLMITNGGQCWLTGSVECDIGDNACSNIVEVAGSTTVFGGNYRSLVVGGRSASTGNFMRVSAGAALQNWSDLIVGSSQSQPGNVGNMLVLTNGAQALGINKVRVADYPSNAFNNVLLITDRAVLEANYLWVNQNATSPGPVAGNMITNAGGIYQFTNALPTIAVSVDGMVYLTSGTISFRAITNADVTCNKKGGKLDATSLMSFAGTNAFRLNNATNLAAGQAYTFTDKLGATNFYRLELFNSSQYRGGAVTIGTNGSLYVSGGVSTIASTLTFNASSTLEIDLSSVTNGSALAALGSVALNGCTLKLNLGTAPAANDTGLILNKQSVGLITGQFAGGNFATGTCNGTNYTFRIQYTAGAGNNSVSVTYVPTIRGTVLLLR